jgi:hypothetical protein
MLTTLYRNMKKFSSYFNNIHHIENPFISKLYLFTRYNAIVPIYVLWRATPLKTHASNYYFVYYNLILQSVIPLCHIYTAHSLTHQYSTEQYKLSSSATSR